MEPILALRLKSFDFTDMQTGLFFAIYPITYTICCTLHRFWPKHLDPRILIVTCVFLNCIAFLLNGPSKVLSLPDKAYIIGIAQFLIGYVDSNLFVLSLPEMIHQANLAFPGIPNKINDYCSGLFNACLGLGFISGPIFGSYIDVTLGFRYT